MATGDSGDGPFDAIAETVDDQTADALELLGSETRWEIIVALWDATERKPTLAEQGQDGLSFSALYDRVGVTDSGQFNYHLDKLTGNFVEQDDGTYRLTRAAIGILSAVIAGTLSDPPSFDDEPVDGDCPLCGASVVIDYEDGTLRIRCTECAGHFRGPNDPPGLLMTTSREVAGLTNRSPQEFFRQGNVVHRHSVSSFIEGVCPNCTGTVTTTPEICEQHESDGTSLCPQCHRRHKIWWHFVCDLCKGTVSTPGRSPIWTETAAMSFCYERGLDLNADHDRFEWKSYHEATDATVSSREPLEIEVTVDLADDRLTVTFDDDANAVDIQKTTGPA